MKRFLIITYLLFCTIFAYSQTKELHAGIDWGEDTLIEDNKSLHVMTAACGSPFLSTGYPAWTNFWAGWMVNIINTNVCSITINSFEARFRGTSGYRIYTKTGTFVGFQTNAAAWTLVGTVASLTGTSTTAPTAIPIAVNVTIPAGGTQAFYLTRSDNLIANRHLYVPGTGAAGVTIYASNTDLSITEANYIDPYFAALQVGVRRPSFDVCYTIKCPLPIELLNFDGTYKNGYNYITWSTASELNNDFFTIERSSDGITWTDIYTTDGAGNSNTVLNYSYNDYTFKKTINYYRLKQTDFNGQFEYSDIIVIDNSLSVREKPSKIINLMGQDVDESYNGIKIYFYPNGTYTKIVETNQ